MKKFLSLVLALTMALSLVTVSTGATDFDDDGDITYQEAVTVIAGMGIVDGYSDGTFGPDEALTRGAAAKIICNLILGPTTADALSASTAPFVDVPTTNTFAGYITYCSQQGIISGYADGTFRPSGTLSGNAFMKMLLGALGYDSEREGYTGSNWTVNVIKQAVGIGLDDGNDDFTGSAAVTREEACLYAFNTLQATMVEYENSSTITVGDITITGQGDYSDVTNGTSSDGNIEDDGLMQFAERYFDDLEAEDGTDDFGRPATNWVYDGDDLGTYANDADESCVVDDASVALSDLLTDNSYLGYSDSDILDDAVIYFNGQEVDDDDSIYEDNDTREDLAGKGDIIEAFENDDGDVDTIVIRSYTYAMIDEVDEDLSSSVQSDGASVGLELVDIDDESLGNGTYYDDHDDDEKVLNGWNSSYEAGTAIAVALGADDAILDSYVMETVTGTPTSARAVDVDDYVYDFAMSNYYSGGAVKTGNITIDGTRYTYAAQFTGLEDGADVDFDSEYVVYLTAEGYALAVDGDATASLDDVYYVVGVYQETSRGSKSYYAQAISLADGTEYDYRLDDDHDEDDTDDLIDKAEDADGDFAEVHAFYEFDADGSSYDATLYTGSSRYDVVTGAVLSADVTSSSTVVRITSGTDIEYSNDDNAATRLYITDTTNFIAAESEGDELDVSTSTGMMTATHDNDPVTVAAIYDDDTDALYVVYAAEELSGATDKSDIVYLADRASTRSGTDTYSGDLYFMDDMSLSEEVDIDEDSDSRDQGFYVYDLSDDVYSLEVDTGNEVDVTDGLVDDDADGYAEFVVFTEGRNNTVSSVTSHNTARSEAGGIFTDGEFDAVSISGALVVDTRDSSDADDDAYSNDINSTSRLISALGEGWVSADVYVEDGDIIFVAVRACMDEGDSADDEVEDADTGDGYLTMSGNALTLYYRSGAYGTSAPDEEEAIALVRALLDEAGYDVGTATEGSGNEWTIPATRNNAERNFEIDLDEDVQEAYAGTLNGDAVWVPTNSATLSNLIDVEEIEGDYVYLNSTTGVSESSRGYYEAADITITGNGFNITDGFVQISVDETVSLDSPFSNAGYSIEDVNVEPIYVEVGDTWEIEVEISVTNSNGSATLRTSRSIVSDDCTVSGGTGVIEADTEYGEEPVTYTVTLSGAADEDSLAITLETESYSES